MGLGPLETMQAHGLIPKNRKTMKSRGIVTLHPSTGGVWMNTYDPDIVRSDISKDPEIRWDIRLIERYHRTRSLKPEVGDYEWVEDFSETVQYIKDKYEATGKAVDVGHDLETMGLVPFIPEKKIITAAFSVEEGQAQMIYLLDKTPARLKRIHMQVQWLLTSPMVSLKGANLKYDLLWWMVKHGIKCTNFKMDTLLVGSMLNENRSNSLKGHACEYTSMGGYETEFETKFPDKGSMENVPKNEPTFSDYVGGDPDACLRVSNVMRGELKNNRNLQHLYVKIIHPAARKFEEIEYHGVEVDLKQFERVRAKVDADAQVCHQKLISLMPRRLKLKYADKDNLLTPKILREFLFTPAGLNLKPKMVTKKTEEATVSMDHLMMFLDDPVAKEFIQTLKKYNSATKTISTFIDGFLKHLRPDGKIHPTYALFNGDLYGYGNSDDDAGTDSGRFSARDPAIHILPKHTYWAKDLRSCYPAPPGHVVFQIDFKEGELRVAADIADDTTMIESYRKGYSLHALTGSKLSQMTIQDFLKKKETDRKYFDRQRQKSKAINFGFLFGLQPKGFKEYARKSFDLEVSMQESEDFRNMFFSTYDCLEGWHNRFIGMAYQNKEVVSPLGRVRHLPLIDSPIWKVQGKQERRAINAPVQGTLSDLCAYGIVHIGRRFTMQEVRLAGMTHDSIYGYIPENHVMDRLREMKHIIENLPLEREFGWKPKVSFPVDAEISDKNLAELEGIDLK